MGMSKRDLLNAERQVVVYQELINAINSGKGKEYTREKDALLKVIGGKEKLDNADKYYAERVAAGDKYFAGRKQAGDDIEGEVAIQIGQRTSALNKQEHESNERAADLQVCIAAFDERKEALVKRTSAVANRERDVQGVENSVANLKESLEGTRLRLLNWEKALDARVERIKAAVA